MYVFGAVGKDGGSLRDCIIKDINMKFKHIDSSSDFIIKSFCDFLRICGPGTQTVKRPGILCPPEPEH